MSSSSTPKTIVLKGDYSIAKERIAAGAITPGHHLALASSGKVAVCAVKTNVPLAVAVEQDFTGGSIATAYAADDTVNYRVLQPGDEFYGFLANGQNVAIGALLESDAAGGFTALAAGTAKAIALEAVNNTSGAQARIKLEVI